MKRIIQVQVTDRCNMRCPYCYIHQKNNDITLDLFIKQFEKCNKLDAFYGRSKDYNIAYFGGEPLLNLEIIYQIEDYLKERHIEHTSHIQTNAILMNDDISEELKKRNIPWSYSFDGLWQKDIMFVNNKNILESSFEVYEKKYNEEFCLRYNYPKIMISPNNIKKYSLLDNYKYFSDVFGNYNPDFTLVRDNIWNDKDIELYKMQLEELVEYLILKTNETKIIKSVGIIDLYLADTIYGKLYGKRPFGCFTGVNGFCFTPIGVIYPCARFYTNNKFPLYDVENDILYEENIIKLKEYTQNKNFKKCQKCELYNYCNAGCTFSQLGYNNFFNCEPIDCFCELLKISYRLSYKYYINVKNNVDFYSYIMRRFSN